jgi:SAM-dependent methyltransferase
MRSLECYRAYNKLYAIDSSASHDILPTSLIGFIAIMTLIPAENLAESRYEYAAQLIKQVAQRNTNAVVIDIGCGTGKMKPIVEAAGLRWHGFDLAPASPEVSRWDLVDPCPAQNIKADLVLLLDVIEHLFNPGLAIKNIADTLAPNGELLMTMPNPHWSRSRIHNLFYGSPANFTQHDLDVNHHVFPPLRHVIERLLSESRLRIVRYATLDGNEVPWPKPSFSARYPLLCVEALGRKMLERFDRSACGMSYAILAGRENDVAAA